VLERLRPNGGEFFERNLPAVSRRSEVLRSSCKSSIQEDGAFALKPLALTYD